MHLENVDLETYPYKDILGLFDDCVCTIHPDVGNFRHAPTGEEYWTITHDGKRGEGEKVVTAKTYEGMFESYRWFLNNLFSHYNYRYTLYFRTLPTIQTYNDEYSLYSRFLISDKPVIQNADYNKNKED